MLLGPCSLVHANAATPEKAGSALHVLIWQELTFMSWAYNTQAVCRDSEGDQWKTPRDLGSSGHESDPRKTCAPCSAIKDDEELSKSCCGPAPQV